MSDKKFRLGRKKFFEDINRYLFRVVAVKDFVDVKEGDVGGWIEKESNLSQSGNAWVYDSACVFDNACVFGNAWVSGNAWVYDNARVSGNAWVYDNTRVYDNALVYDNAWVYDNALVYGNAVVCDDAKVYGNAYVYGNAMVFDNAWVSGNARVYGNAKVCEEQWVNMGYVNKSLKIKKYSFIAQIGIMPKKEGNILYKKVYKIKKGVYRSVFDENFIYKDGKISRVKNPDKAHVGCSTGIHLSRLLYWDEGDTWIACEFDWKDVITVQQGKVRVKKCKVLGEVKLI